MSGFYQIWPPPTSAGSGGGGTITSVSVVTANGFAGGVSGGATPAITLSTTITGFLQGNGTAISAVPTTGSGSIVLTSGPTMTNPVVGTQSQGDASTKAASTSYVDTAVANAVAGVNPAVAVQAATVGSGDTSSFTYSNGVAGIGATFTGAINTAVTIDGFTFNSLTQRLLVKNDTQSPSGAFNGVYTVTQLQSGIVAPILTRALDYDTPSDINNTGTIPVVNGTVNGTTSWVQTAQVVTVGTTPMVFVKFTRNPADYLLVANNLSDVNTKSTSFNNLSPMTTGGDLIYGGAAGVGTRLANGSSGQVLTSAGGTSAPTWGPVSLVTQTVGSLSLTNQVVGNLALSQTSGSISLTNQVSGILPQGNLTLTPTFTQATLGSATVTSSASGAATTFTLPGGYGTAGQALAVSSAGFLSFQTITSGPAAPAYTYTTMTTTSSASIGQWVVMSGASFSVGLPTAASVAGQSIILQHGGTSLTQTYTILTVGGQTVGGIAGGSYALNTNNETLTLLSDGSVWQIASHMAVTQWSNGVATTVTASSVNPVKGGQVNKDSIRWKREGQYARIRIDYMQNITGSATNGTGIYLFTMPTNMTIDTTYVTASVDTVVATSAGTPQSALLGTFWIFAGSSNRGIFLPRVWDTTRFGLTGYNSGTATGQWDSGSAMGFGTGTLGVGGEGWFPIVGWQP